MSLSFQKASKKLSRLRLSLIGVAGSGKTYTALNIAKHLGGPIAVVDTERGSASKYSDIFDFDVLELESFSPQNYIDAIQAAEEAGYNVLIIDSLSHAWTGKDGALDQVTRATKRSQSGNTFAAWRDVTPMHNAMVEAMLNARVHIITTMRAKTEYVQEKNEKTGKVTVRKVGLAPVQRDGLEYEFDVVADLDQDNNLIIGKTRCPAVAGMVIPRAGKEIAQKLLSWLSDGGANAEAKNGFARSETVAPAPRATPKAAAEAPVVSVADEFEADSIQCHCSVPARYVRGKSGAGWVCGNMGTSQPSCDFRLKDATGEEDPYEGGNENWGGRLGELEEAPVAASNGRSA
jgi:hypothetical protein